MIKIFQSQYGQGSHVGGQCLWDSTRDKVISVNKDLDKYNVSCQVFFISIAADDEDEDDDDNIE